MAIPAQYGEIIKGVQLRFRKQRNLISVMYLERPTPPTIQNIIEVYFATFAQASGLPQLSVSHFSVSPVAGDRLFSSNALHGVKKRVNIDMIAVV
jgi:hypothetical protein